MGDVHRAKVEIELKPATEHDVAAMVQMHTKAFADDQFSNFMLQGRPQGTHEAWVQRSIEGWMNDPSAKIMLARNTDGQVLGWLCVVFKQKDGNVSAEPNSNNDTSRPTAKPSPNLSCSEAKGQLGNTMYEDSVQAENKHMTEDEYVVLQAIATHPDWQHRGIGTRLVQWAIEEADTRRHPCWVHASPAAYPLYRRLGFAEVERSEFDLDAWASAEHKAAVGNWGSYTFRCMKRPLTEKTKT